MRMSLILTATILVPAVASATKKNWWTHDGDMCNTPKGPYTNICYNIEVAYSKEYQEDPCKFSAFCKEPSSTGKPSFHVLRFPQAVTFLDVNFVNGSFTNPLFAELARKYAGTSTESNPCKVPTGNYQDSCTDISITFLPFAENDLQDCLLKANCDKWMRKHNNSTSPYNTDNLHNEVLIPRNVLFTNVKNLNGKLIHPSNDFNSTSELCHESGSTEHVAMEHSGHSSNNDAANKISLAVAIGAAVFLARP